jgi:adenine/guanine phosphoribosyltransferase-like PRPP-binding protein
MEGLSASKEAIRTAAAADWPFRVADLARDLEVELGHPDVLTEIADRFVVIAEEYGCQAVMGASRVGGQLAGAVVARAENGLRMFSAVDPAEVVLVIDGMLATGTQIARAVRAMKRAGAKRAVAVAVLGNPDAIPICRDEIQDDIVVLDEF